MGANGRLKKQIQKRNAEPQQEQAMQGEGIMGTAMQAADPNQRGQMAEGKIRQVEDMTAMMMQMIHGDKTKESVMRTLKAQPDPHKAIPSTVNMLFKRVDQQSAKRKMKVPNDIKVATASYVVMDLANLGNAARIWEQPVQQDELGPILRNSMQMYMKDGLKDGTIDPVELQMEVEQVMSDEQKAAGVMMGRQAGVDLPPGPTEQMAVDREVEKQVSAERAKTEQARAQAQAMQGNVPQARAAKAESVQEQQAATPMREPGQQPPV